MFNLYVARLKANLKSGQVESVGLCAHYIINNKHLMMFEIPILEKNVNIFVQPEDIKGSKSNAYKCHMFMNLKEMYLWQANTKLDMEVVLKETLNSNQELLILQFGNFEVEVDQSLDFFHLPPKTMYKKWAELFNIPETKTIKKF